MRIKKLLCVVLAVTMLSALTACGSKKGGTNTGDNPTNFNQLAPPQSGDTVATITVKNYGDIKIRLFKEYAPKAVENFTALANKGYYNERIFHRIILDFMLQGGDPTGTGMGGESIWGQPFEDEFSDQLHNYRGALSMANSGADTNGSQFFIVQKGPMNEQDFTAVTNNSSANFTSEVKAKYLEIGGTPWLDNLHTVFGQVFEGMDVVDKIAGVSVDGNDKPLNDVVIERIIISTANN